MTSYSEKLKDPRWQKKRLEIFDRDKWTCKYCGEKEKTLHVHHLFYTYKLDPWDVHDGFLITLCEDCHFNEGDSDDISICDSINNDIGVLLSCFWSPGFNCSDILTLSEEIHYVKKLPYPVWEFSISQHCKKGWF